MNQSSLFSSGSSLPEPNWQPISKPTTGGPITQAIDREADNRMMLDQSYMKDQMMNIAMDFDDDEEEDVFEF